MCVSPWGRLAARAGLKKSRYTEAQIDFSLRQAEGSRAGGSNSQVANEVSDSALVDVHRFTPKVADNYCGKVQTGKDSILRE